MITLNVILAPYKMNPPTAGHLRRQGPDMASPWCSYTHWWNSRMESELSQMGSKHTISWTFWNPLIGRDLKREIITCSGCSVWKYKDNRWQINVLRNSGHFSRERKRYFSSISHVYRGDSYFSIHKCKQFSLSVYYLISIIIEIHFTDASP